MLRFVVRPSTRPGAISGAFGRPHFETALPFVRRCTTSVIVEKTSHCRLPRKQTTPATIAAEGAHGVVVGVKTGGSGNPAGRTIIWWPKRSGYKRLEEPSGWARCPFTGLASGPLIEDINLRAQRLAQRFGSAANRSVEVRDVCPLTGGTVRVRGHVAIAPAVPPLLFYARRSRRALLHSVAQALVEQDLRQFGV